MFRWIQLSNNEVKEYSLTPKAWVSPKGEQAIVPKDEGYGIMMSAFQSREFVLECSHATGGLC